MKVRLLAASAMVASGALVLTACGSSSDITEVELPEPTTSESASPEVEETPEVEPTQDPEQPSEDESEIEETPEPEEEQEIVTPADLTVELSKDLDGNGVLVSPMQVMTFTDLENKDDYRIEFSNPDIMILSEARPEDNIEENEFFTPTYSIQASEPGISLVSVIKEADDSVYYEITVEAKNSGFILNTTDSDPSEWEPALIYPDMVQMTLVKGQRATFAFEAKDVQYDSAYLEVSEDLQTVTAVKNGRSVMDITYTEGDVEKKTAVVVVPVKSANLRTLTLIDELVNARTVTEDAVEALEATGVNVVVLEPTSSAPDLDENTFYLVERRGTVVAGGQ
jgi:hypothetical protein